MTGCIGGNEFAWQLPHFPLQLRRRERDAGSWGFLEYAARKHKPAMMDSGFTKAIHDTKPKVRVVDAPLADRSDARISGKPVVLLGEST